MARIAPENAIVECRVVRRPSATSAFVVEDWRPDRLGSAARRRDLADLAGILHDVVHTGAGVSFVVPFSRREAAAFWRGVLRGVRAGTRRMLVARAGHRIVGTVQIDLRTPPNQAHRAEVLKLLVHPDARRQGVARALMRALEPVARAAGRTRLTLDTWSGSPAERLYRSLGYVVVGRIPRYARGSTTHALEPTTIMYKEIDRPLSRRDRSHRPVRN